MAGAGEAKAIPWLRDLEQGLREAKRAGRLVLVQFLRADRPLCEAMKEKTLAALPVVAFVSSRFVAVQLDAEAQAALFERLSGGRGALASVVVDDTGDPVASLAGFAEPASFMRFLEDAIAAYPALLAARTRAARRPKDAALAVALGLAYERAGGQLRAEQVLAGVIRTLDQRTGLTPAELSALALAHERLARWGVMRGRNLEARAHLARLEALDPQDRQGLEAQRRLTEGLALAVERRAKEARPLLEQLVARPALAEREHALFALGLVQHDLRDDQAALATLGRLVAEFPRGRWRGRAEEQVGHIKNPQPDHQH